MFGKNCQKVFFEKTECLANTYIYIYIYMTIKFNASNASYGHKCFIKISQSSLYDKLSMVDKKVIMLLVGPNRNQ